MGSILRLYWRNYGDTNEDEMKRCNDDCEYCPLPDNDGMDECTEVRAASDAEKLQMARAALDKILRAWLNEGELREWNSGGWYWHCPDDILARIFNSKHPNGSPMFAVLDSEQEYDDSFLNDSDSFAVKTRAEKEAYIEGWVDARADFWREGWRRILQGR
jgi:hypothetical protein